MFVRIKKIKGRPYAYLVANEWTPWGSRQTVVNYLGRSYPLERLQQEVWELPSGFAATILSAVEQELMNHGFLRYEDKFVYGNVCVNLKKGTIKNGKKGVVLGMNEGFLCEHTLHELLEFTLEERPDKSAKKIATLALEAGLKLSQEQFVHLFEQAKSLKGNEEKQEA